MRIKSDFDVEYLQAFMDLALPERISVDRKSKGECFYRSVALVLDKPAWALTVGTLPGVSKEVYLANTNQSPTPFLHCWVEFNDCLLLPTRIERDGNELKVYGIEDYYRRNRVQNAYHISGRRTMELAKTNGWYGFFLTGERHAGSPIAETVLAEARVAYTMSSRGGFVPPGTIMPDYAN